MNRKVINNTFIKQHDQSDCGVACLLSVLQYHDGQNSLENLRELSGTTKQGTTVLGLYQAANQLGFKADAYEAELKDLRESEHLSILHVIIDNRLQHYVLYYGFERGKYIIGDPARGIVEYTEEELKKIWKSKALLYLEPTDKIVQQKTIKKDKWNWFKYLLKEDVNFLTIIFILSLLISVLGMVMAIFSQKLIDDILPSKDGEKLIVSLVLVAILLFARGFIGYIAGFFGIQQGRNFNNRLIGRFFENLLFLPKSFFDNRRIGELVERMNDTSKIQTTIAKIVGELLKNFLLFLIGEIVLFIYSPAIGALSLISLPLFGFISWKYHKRIVNSQHELMAANAHKSSNYVNSMNGISSIKSNHKEKEFSNLNKLIYGLFQDKAFNLGKLGISLQMAAEFASVFVTVGLIAFGTWMVFADLLTAGELIAILGISSSVFPAIVSLAFANISLQGAKVAFDRMYEFSAIKPEFENEKGKIPNQNIRKLDVRKLSFRFPGRKQLLKDISLNAQKGEIISLLGESGCGKTTFLNILQQFYPPESGNILVDGIKLNKISIPQWRNKLAMVSQEVDLFNGTLIENICLGATQEQMQECVKFCEEMGFQRYFMEFPQDYGTLLGEEGINISGGQKQLVGLARALWKKPQVLLLDEPSSAMDRNTENFVLELLGKLKDEMIVILVTHRIKIARYSDRIYILENGETCLSGKHKDLMLSENLYSLSFQEIAGNEKSV